MNIWSLQLKLSLLPPEGAMSVHPNAPLAFRENNFHYALKPRGK